MLGVDQIFASMLGAHSSDLWWLFQFLLGHAFSINELLTKQFEPVLDLQRKNHWCRLHDKSRWGFAPGFAHWENLHSAPACINRSVNPASCDSSYCADPNHHKPSTELCSQKQRRLQRRGTWSSPNFYVINLLLSLLKNNSCKFITCLLFPLLKCFLNVSKYCSNAVV